MLQREDLLPVKLAEALVEGRARLDDPDDVLRVWVEAGVRVSEIGDHGEEAIRLAAQRVERLAA